MWMAICFTRTPDNEAASQARGHGWHYSQSRALCEKEKTNQNLCVCVCGVVGDDIFFHTHHLLTGLQGYTRGRVYTVYTQ